jgi:16S rRNA (cytosine967-C5)-methyltransferase
VASARSVALDALLRIDEGAYANLVLPALLERSGLDERDRHFATELVYGATRMRRACDWRIGRFVTRRLDPPVRAALRLGAYQLTFLNTQPHAAVDATVGVAPIRARGLVNAVLRRIADAGRSEDWPDEATRLSYPDWVLGRLTQDLGEAAAVAALEAMNEPAAVTRRADGYVQDLASQWVAGLVGVQPGERILDLCAAPGGKATAMAHSEAAVVVATDVWTNRASRIKANSRDLALSNVAAVVADGRRPPFRPATFDRILVDAPCSGLGAFRRRPDARWRIQPDDVESLAALQRELLEAALELLRPGGALVYAACTLTQPETNAIDDWLASRHPELVAVDGLPVPWRPHGRGGLLLPQDAATDGMFVWCGTRRP